MALSGKRVACPKCREEGKDSKGNHLNLFQDQTGGWCVQGGHGKVLFDETDVPQRRQRMTYNKQENLLTLASIKELPIKAIPLRLISEETCERYGVRTECNEATGELETVYYPYHDNDGSVVGYKRRHIASKEFKAVGKIKGLFGKKQCKPNAKFVAVVEGEHDVLAAWEILKASKKNWNVVSIPNGANEKGTLDDALLKELNWLAQHKTVCLMFDSDDAGQTMARSLAETLVSQTEVRIATLPRKDTAKCLEDGLLKEWIESINSSKLFQPEAIVEGRDLKAEDFRKSKNPGAMLKFPKLQEMTWGLRKGEITLVVAGPGLGKSSFVREICYDLSLQGYKIANIALETPMEDLVNYYVAMDNNIPGYKLVFNHKLLSDDEYQQSFDKLCSTNNMSFFKWWGNIDSDVLLKKLRYFVKAVKVDFIMIDHISIATAGEENERLEIDRLFEKLTQLVVETGVGILAVMHLRKVAGKNFNRGDEIDLEDIRGSAGAAQMSWNVWGVERNQQGDNKNTCRLRVLKNRTIGFTGPADYLKYDHETGRMKTLDLEV